MLVLPWCKYRTVRSPGSSGIWSGSSHNEVLVRRWWGWTRVLGAAAPGFPIVLTPTAILVITAGEGARILTESAAETPLACGNKEALPSVPANGGVVDCVDHLAGPAPAVATALRVRRVDSAGELVSSQDFTLVEPRRVFLSPAVSFYDEEGTPYLVTFRDPWVGIAADGSRQRGVASPEQLANIRCEILRVGPGQAKPVPAPPGHSVSDCSEPSMWSQVLGLTLKGPWSRVKGT